MTISPDITLRQALEIMTKYRISGLPVTRGTRLTGILHGCLNHHTHYDEHNAWAHRTTTAA